MPSNSAFPGFGRYRVVTCREGKPIIHEMIVRSWLQETDTGMCREDCVILYGFPAVSGVNACSGGLKIKVIFAWKQWQHSPIGMRSFWNSFCEIQVPIFLSLSASLISLPAPKS